MIPCAAGEGEDAASTDAPAVPAAHIPTAGVLAPITVYKERLLLVDINRQQLDQAVLVLEDRAGALYLWSNDLQRWRLHPPVPETAIKYQGETYFPLSALAHVSHVYDRKELTLMIEVRADAFINSRLTTRYDTLPPPERPNPGGFINYDLFAARSADSVQRSGLFELGMFNRYGVGTTNLLADNLGSHPHVIRLDTTWTIDFPEKLRTLRLGDAINAPGSWGRAVQFGGIQYGTNFATQPGYVTFPVQSAAGLAVLPSTVDVFINNALVSRQNVQPGPFSISNLPVISGAGEVQLVVRDVMGREQVITRPFYASQALLREGLKDYSFELGRVRNNFGITSNDYGSWLGSGTFRRGMSESFTGEFHAEVMHGAETVGVGGDTLLPQIGTLSSYIVGSHDPTGKGGMALLGIQRQAERWGAGARTQFASRGFSQVGQDSSLPPPVHSSSLNLSYAGGSAGSIGVGYIRQHNRDQGDTRLATLSYSVSLGTIGSFSLSALRNLSGEASTTIFALLSFPLNPSTNLSVSSQSTRGGGTRRSDLTTTLQRNLPMGDGYGYRLQARSDNDTEAMLALQNNVGTYTLEAAQNQGATATRLSVSGGVAFLSGDAFASRRIDQSFAVARIPDYPNVRVLTDNQPAGRTDAHGDALIPRLRPYDINVISIDQRDVPLDAAIGKLRLDVVPYYRSGVDVRFPIRHSRGATLTLLLEDGSPLPVGAMVQRNGQDELFTVGYGGEVYVTDLGPVSHLRARWLSHSCEVDVRFIATADPLPDLGKYVCLEVPP